MQRHCDGHMLLCSANVDQQEADTRSGAGDLSGDTGGAALQWGCGGRTLEDSCGEREHGGIFGVGYVGARWNHVAAGFWAEPKAVSAATAR